MKEHPNLKIRVWRKPIDEMDVWLDNEGYYRKHTAKDGSCLFRAVSEQIFLTQAFHGEVRRQIVEFMLRNEKYFQKQLSYPLMEHAEKMYSPREWGGKLEIEAMSLMYKCDFIMFKELNTPPERVTNNNFKTKLMLCHSLDKHYDPVYTKEYISTAAFCQSTIYEMLYKNVFELKEVDYAVNKMLHDKSSRYQREHIPFLSSRFALRLEMRDSYLNVKELLDYGITPFPYKVAKSLDIDIYRNVEYDTWNEYRKGLRYGYCAWTCQEIQVGAKCLVKYEDKDYHGHVQEMQPNKGPVVVFVEELGEMRTVPYNTLELIQPTSPSINLGKPTLPIKLHPLHLVELRNDVLGKKSVKSLIGRLKNAKDLELNLRNEKQKSISEDKNSFASQSPTQSPVISSTEFPEQENNYEENVNEYSAQHFQSVTQVEEQVCQENIKPDLASGIQPMGFPVYQQVSHPPNTLNIPNQEPSPLYQQPVTVNLMANKSINADGSDLPHSDIQTLRFFYNLGLDHLRMNYVIRPGTPYYVATPAVVQPSYVTADSPTIPAFEAFQYTSQGGSKRQNNYEGAPLIQHCEVSSTTGGTGTLAPTSIAPSTQPMTTPQPPAPTLQHYFHQPQTPDQDGYFVPYVDYSYDYPIYPQSPLLPPSPYLMADGVIYQTVITTPTLVQTHPQSTL